MRDLKKVIKTCLLAGRIMIENGSEMSRAEDTMKRIAINSGIDDLQLFGTITGLIVSVPDSLTSQVEQITRRAFDLEKVSAVNSFSREYAAKQITLDEFYEKLSTMLVGALGYTVFYLSNRLLNVKYISEFFASIVIGILAVLIVRMGWGQSLDDIIIGSVMPLVPGVPLTNAVRDILNGHLVSGPARGVEALLSACAIGFGIAFVFRFI